MMNEQALKERLKTVAREKNLPFNACWRQLLLERFLARLSGSTHSNKFIFKGGALLAYLMKIGRETMDLDFLLTRMNAGQKELTDIFGQILSVHSEDGFTFSLDSIELLTQPHMGYPGYRVVLNSSFGRMKDKIQVDLGIGDVVEPLTREIPFVQYLGKPLFEGTISLQVYPIETIFSEKLETVLSKGAGNSRMKDYHDIIFLIRKKETFNLEKLKGSATNTFSNRGTALHPITFDESSCKTLQKLWVAHIHALGANAKDFDLPQAISTVIAEINQFIAEVFGLRILGS